MPVTFSAPRRVVFNLDLVVALAVATIGSAIQINNRVIQNEKVRQLFGLPPVREAAEPATPPAPTGPARNA